MPNANTVTDRKAEHTPGPWRVGSNYGAIVTDVDHPGVWTDLDNKIGYGGFLVCESVRSEANARLIASAPRLFDALKGMVGLIQLIQAREPSLVSNHRFLEALDALAEASESESIDQ